MTAEIRYWILFIVSSLEESEREETCCLKWFKTKLTKLLFKFTTTNVDKRNLVIELCQANI